MTTEVFGKRSLARFVLLLFGLSLPIWIVGAEYDVELFSGFRLFQLPLAMPAVAAVILTFREQGRDGVAALLGRCLDFSKIGPKIWLLAIVLLYPPPEYDPRLSALVTVSYVAIVTSLWGRETLARFRFSRAVSRC